MFDKLGSIIFIALLISLAKAIPSNCSTADALSIPTRFLFALTTSNEVSSTVLASNLFSMFCINSLAVIPWLPKDVCSLSMKVLSDISSCRDSKAKSVASILYKDCCLFSPAKK